MNREVPVLVCEHAAEAGAEPAEVVARLGRRGLTASVVEGLCDRPTTLEGRAGGTRLVLGLCERRPGPEELQARARRAGLGPFDAEVVPVSDAAMAPDPAARLAALLHARAAGLAARGRTLAAHLRPELAGEGLTRRSLLAGGPWTYRSVAAVAEGCLGRERCGLCVAACPAGAIGGGGRPAVDAERCRACGACVAVCPVGAATLPDADLPGLEAELAVLIEEGRAANVPLALVCGSAPPVPEEGDRVPVRLPCLSMVTAGWLLQLLAAGAPGVVLAGCGDACRVGGAGRARAVVEAVRRVLAEGDPAAGERVRLSLGGASEGAVAPAAASLGGSAAASAAPPVGGSAAASAVPPIPASTRSSAVAPTARDEGLRLSEPWATTAAAVVLLPSGSVVEDLPTGAGMLAVADRCTLCGLCASVCPTGAVALEAGAEASALSFDPASCAGCANCVRICPEDALRLSRRLDRDALAQGRRRLRTGARASCRACGAPVAPVPMLERIGELLADQGPGLLRLLSELCPDCRATGRAPAGDPTRT